MCCQYLRPARGGGGGRGQILSQRRHHARHRNHPQHLWRRPVLLGSQEDLLLLPLPLNVEIPFLATDRIALSTALSFLLLKNTPPIPVTFAIIASLHASCRSR